MLCYVMLFYLFMLTDVNIHLITISWSNIWKYSYYYIN